MKLFGEYLIEQKIVSEDQLAAALVEQLRLLPSVAEVSQKEKLLNSHELLQVFKEETNSGLGFLQSAHKLGLWSTDKSKALQENLSKIRIPLGQILVKQKYTSIDKITNALDDFLSEWRPEEKKRVAAEPIPESPEATIAASEAQASASSDPQTALYLEIFNEANKKELDGFFQVLMIVAGDKNLSQAYDDSLKKIRTFLYQMRGAARLLSSKTFEAQIALLEVLFMKLTELGIMGLSAEEAQQATLTGELGVRLIWDMKNAVLESGSAGSVSAKEAQSIIDFKIGVETFSVKK